MTEEEIRVAALKQAVKATRLSGSYPSASTVTAFASYFENYLNGKTPGEEING